MVEPLNSHAENCTLRWKLSVVDEDVHVPEVDGAV
jgi:hypothetical protein